MNRKIMADQILELNGERIIVDSFLLGEVNGNSTLVYNCAWKEYQTIYNGDFSFATLIG